MVGVSFRFSTAVIACGHSQLALVTGRLEDVLTKRTRYLQGFLHHPAMLRLRMTYGRKVFELRDVKFSKACLQKMKKKVCTARAMKSGHTCLLSGTQPGRGQSAGLVGRAGNANPEPLHMSWKR